MMKSALTFLISIGGVANVVSGLTLQPPNDLNEHTGARSLRQTLMAKIIEQKKTCGICNEHLLLQEFGHAFEAEANTIASSVIRYLSGVIDLPGIIELDECDSRWPFKDCGPVCNECYNSKTIQCCVCQDEILARNLDEPPTASPCHKHAEVICKSCKQSCINRSPDGVYSCAVCRTPEFACDICHEYGKELMPWKEFTVVATC